MSSAVFTTSAAQGRHFVFDDGTKSAIYPTSEPPCPFQPTGAELFSESKPPGRVVAADRGIFAPGAFSDKRLAGIRTASSLAVRPAPDMVFSGIAEMDVLTGGLPRGCLTEVCGTASSGRSTFMLAALSAATGRGEFCAVVDASDALDPQSLAAAGVELERLLWVRCGDGAWSATAGPSTSLGMTKAFLKHTSRTAENRATENRLGQLLRVTDLLLESGGFGLIVLDLGDLPAQTARKIPMATWFRFRRAVEHTPTVLLVIERQSIAGSCSSLLMHLSLNLDEMNASAAVPSHAQLLTHVQIKAELARSRMERKPVQSAETAFAGKTAWAG